MGSGTTATLRQLLQCLCHNTQWRYAVLWKLKRMELTWEDGYFDDENSGGFLSAKPGMISFGRGIDIKSGNSMKCPIKMAVTSLSCLTYPLGKGIVGKVALKKKHHWTYADETLQGEFPEEWNKQSAAGIKTILLVSILPLGVVQLGSLDMVFEDLREVIHIRDYFGTIHNTSGACNYLSPTMDLLDSYTPLVMPSADPALTVNVIDQLFGMDSRTFTDESKWQSTLTYLFTDDFEEPPAVELSVFTDNVAEGDLSAFSFFEDELDVISSINHRSISSPPMTPNPHIKHRKRKDCDQSFSKEFVEETNSVIDHKCLSFPSDSELHKALGLISEGHGNCMQNTIVPKAGEWGNSVAFCQMELPEVFRPVFEDADAWFTEERGTEQLLDAVIAKLLDSADDNESECVRSCSKSSSKCSDSCLTCSKTEDDALDLGESVLLSYKRSMLTSKNEDATNSPARSSHETVHVSSSPGQKDVAHELYKKHPKSTNVTKKRGNASDGHKPKPRDRQLIQERIKELRELIPDSSKCSIDVLLDQTIKHMLFLQNVPDQAEKLMHSTQTMVNSERWISSRHRACQNGASRASELGHKSEQCPLTVENLDRPGQILVEMQCEDHGLFLEMAQVIKRLKLTILKGVLETKSDKPWAHFIIEAPRGFHRTDILWPLVQLLQFKNIPMAKMF